MKFNSLYPEFLVKDFERSVAFYVETLGFHVEYERPEEKFAFLSFEGAQIMLLQDNPNAHSRTGPLDYPRGQGVNFSIMASSIAPMEISLAKIGHPLRIPVREQWHRIGKILQGERQLWVMDPDGYLLRFIEDLGTKAT